MLEKIKGMLPINYDLIGNPINWVIVLVMIMIAGLAIGLVFHPSNSDVSKNG